MDTTALTEAQITEAAVAENKAFLEAAGEEDVKSFEAPAPQPIHSQETPAGTPLQEAKEPEYTPDPKLEELIQQRIAAREKTIREDYHRMESKFGRMEKQLQETLSKAATPANANVRKVLDSLPEFKEMQIENPEYAKVFETLAANVAAPDVSGMLAQMQNQLRTEHQAELTNMRLDLKHEGWEKTVQTPEFIEFVFTDGPTPEERGALKSIEALMAEANQKRDARAATAYQSQWQARLNEQIRRYPQWWSTTGAEFYSDQVNDSISLLDKFKDRANEKEPSTTTPDKRLQRDVEPTSGRRPPLKPKPQTEREAMEAAFYS